MNIRLSLVAAIAVAALTANSAPALSHAQAKGLCFGKLRVSPARVHVGGRLTLHGSHFTCTEPSGHLFPTAPVFLYKPGAGFTIYNVKVARNGTYTKTIVVRQKLIAMAAINGGKQVRVAARPGKYYLSISLFDVHVPPPSQSLARVTVLG